VEELLREKLRRGEGGDSGFTPPQGTE
jgi:hypothetical protein